MDTHVDLLACPFRPALAIIALLGIALTSGCASAPPAAPVGTVACVVPAPAAPPPAPPPVKSPAVTRAATRTVVKPVLPPLPADVLKSSARRPG